MGESERERLQRLRDQQIKARDPGDSMIPGYDWKRHAEHGRKIVAKQRRQARKPFLLALYEVMPGRAQGAVFGFLVLAIPSVAGLLFVHGEWQMLLIIPPLIGAGMGYLIGMMLEPDRDLYM